MVNDLGCLTTLSILHNNIFIQLHYLAFKANRTCYNIHSMYCINDVAHSRKWRHLANILKLLFPDLFCVVIDVSGAFNHRYKYLYLCFNLMRKKVRVYTVFSFFVFKFANEKRITNSFFVFRFQICERKTNSFFVFKSEVRKTKNEFVFRFCI